MYSRTTSSKVNLSLGYLCVLLLAMAFIYLSSGMLRLPIIEATVPGRGAIVAQLPLAFEPNAGQTDRSVRFMSRASGGTLFFTQEGVTLSLPKAQSTAPVAEPGVHASAQGVEIDMARMLFVGANPAVGIQAGPLLPGKVNYLLGSDPSAWRTGIDTYASVTYKGLYPGIDLLYEGTAGQLKGTYTISAQADPSSIRWRYAGASQPTIDSNGNLLLHVNSTGGASPLLIEQMPVAWQEGASGRVPVEAHYNVAGNGTVGFTLGNYDSRLPLVIDPVLTYSTYLGGSSDDDARDIAVDSAGNVYVTGFTNSANFPSVNGFESTYKGNSDAFVSKLSPDGRTLLYSTYLGGAGLDQAYAVAVDGSGSIYVSGSTYSIDFPVAAALQAAKSGGADAFLAKLNSTGSALVYSTYFGGSQEDHGRGIVVDASGALYVTGYTASIDFPLASPIQASIAGSWDVFLAKLNPGGSAMVYSTYIGGGSQDEGEGITLDSAGNVYLAGFTRSTNFPTVTPFQATNRGGRYDGYLTKINSTGSAIVYSTYLGGNSIDIATDVAVDAQGSAYVVGGNSSLDFPIANAFQPLPGGNFLFDAYITKFSPSGTTLVYSTFLGGGADDEAKELAVDAAGNVNVTGYTYSTDFPVVNPIQTANAGLADVFVTRLNASGQSLDYSTYLGGSDAETGWAIAGGATGNVYVAGTTSSTNFPTANAYQPNTAGGSDAFVARIFEPVAPPTPTATLCPLQFSDVPSTNTFYASVRCLACRGIVSGYSDGTFRPNNPVTRGQLAKMVSNAAGFNEPVSGQTFQDVPPSNTFYVWIERLTRRGHMSGYNCGGPGEPCINNRPYFRPYANATRGQTAKIVSNAAGFTETQTGQTFQDVPPTHTFYQEIQRLASRNVMGGYACGGPGEPCVNNRPYFRPNNDVTRGQSAKIVANTFFPNCQTP